MGLTTYQRERVITLWRMSGTYTTCTEIQRALGREGITTTRQTVRRTIDRWKLLGGVCDRARSGRPKAIPDEHYKYIDHLLSENDELTAKDLIEHMTAKFGPVTYSERTMARARQDLGWTYSTARYCQAIREQNKLKRLVWCQDRLKEDERFDNVIFTDESSIVLEVHRRKSFRKRGQPRKLKYKHKHPLKIHVWAGISKQGATGIVMFNGILTATRYADILSASLIPFIQTAYSDGHRLYQDNDPKHTSRYIQHFFEEHDITWWKSPAESPDLNPIEKVWGSMKTYLRDKHKPKNMADLKAGIKLYWKKMTPDVCARYIAHLSKVLPDVITEQGGPTGH